MRVSTGRFIRFIRLKDWRTCPLKRLADEKQSRFHERKRDRKIVTYDAVRGIGARAP
ncbi:MAG: hypothetical protein GF353_27240 [Candidatus Lokiarchaeota archaeon]|nr:hypothetical protein [Candidatus Lokiarchaeota archaeon]